MIKKLIFHKGISDIFLAVSFVSTLISFILYIATGVTEFATSLSSVLIAILIISLVLEAALLVFGFKTGKYIVFLLMLYGFFHYLYTQITYIANVFASIDGNSFSASFLFTVILLIMAFGFALASGILAKDEKEIFKEVKK